MTCIKFLNGFVLLLALVSLLGLQSCKQHAAPKEENPLARVYGNYLYQSDIQGIGKGLSLQDSSYQVKNYIDKWIIDQLVLGVALKKIQNKDASEIDRLVEAYRASLIVAQYEQDLVNQQLDTVVTAVQLADYYNKNKEQYISGFSYVRCFFLRIPRDLTEANDVRRWFKSGKDSDVEKLRQFCTANEEQVVFAMEENRWLKFDLVLAKLPDRELSERYLNSDRVYDRSTDEYIYLYKTFEYKDKEDPAPLSQVQDEISRIILHQRRKRILDELRNTAFEKAKEGAVFERY